MSLSTEKKSDLDTDIKKSGDRLLELKAGRHNDDIPISDEYWIALQNHNIHFGLNLDKPVAKVEKPIEKPKSRLSTGRK